MQITIRAARVNAGLTQAQMAQALKLDRGTYSRIEKNPGRATIDQIKAISAVTGIPFAEIFLP